MKKCKIQLINPYEIIPEEFIHKPETYRNYNEIKIDIPFSSVIIGSSGAGKTKIAYNLYTSINAFTHVYLYVKDLDEPIYKYIIDRLEKLGKRLGTSLVTYSSNIDDVPLVEEFDQTTNNLCIFDDVMLDKCPKIKNQKNGNDKILDIYIRGRRQNISVLYIAQSYYNIPQVIRKNANYVFVKKISTVRDLKGILSEYQLDRDPKTVMQYYKDSLLIPNSFLMIDLKTQNPNLRYRLGYDGIQQN